jgi:ATP-dependent Clp protease ATP-binding subunit ClpA
MMLEKNPNTPALRDVLKFSNTEAGRLGHDYIGPEHFMLALIRMNQGLAINALRGMHVNPEQLRRGIERQLKEGKGPTIGLVMSNEKAKRVLELAQAAAQQLGHGWVGTEHLLLGILREESNIPARCLQNLGVDYEKAQNEVIALIEQHAGPGPAGAGDEAIELTLPLDQMTVEEKLCALERIWEDLCRNEADVPSPGWHRDVLEAREKRAAQTAEPFSDWEDAKRRIRKSAS